MTRKDQNIARMKKARQLAKNRAAGQKVRALNTFIRHLNKVRDEVPEVPQKGSILRTLTTIIVAVRAEKHV